MTITDQELDGAEKAFQKAWAVKHSGLRDAIRAALLSVEQGRGWRPIETAPKDESYVLLWRKLAGSARCRVLLARWNGRYWNTGKGTIPSEGSLTHWMPLEALPPPPHPRSPSDGTHIKLLG